MGLFDNLFGKNEPPKFKIGDKEYQADPNSLGYSQLGLDSYNTKDYRSAVQYFSEALKTNSTNQNLYVMRGTAYEDMGNDIEAEKDFLKAVEMKAGFLALYRYGMVQYRKKNLPEAIKWLKNAHADFPDFITKEMGIGSNNIMYVGKQVICANLGSFLLQTDQYDESLKFSKEAVSIDPNYSTPYVNIGVALFKKGKADEAIPYIRKASTLGHSNAPSILQAIEQSIAQQQKSQSEDLNFVFKSSDHIRRQNGKTVSGPHGGAPRAIKVEPNINGGEGYTVSMFNLEGPHPLWQNNVQMAPKQMRIAHTDSESIVLRGFGRDAMGASFADYGLIIHLNDGQIEGCTLNMLDRGIDISYYP